MREINIDLSNLDEQYDCGNCGEIKASKLNIDISKMAKADFYVVVFRNSLAQTYCTERFYEEDIEDGIISVELWQDLTRTKSERAVVEAYTEENDELKMLEKSAVINLHFDGSISSDDALNEEEPEGLYLSLLKLEKNLKEAAENAENISNTLTEKLNAGEFNGPQGAQGPQGPPGKDAVTDTELSVDSNNAIANSAVAKVLGNGKCRGIFCVNAEDATDIFLKYHGNSGTSPLADGEYILLCCAESWYNGSDYCRGGIYVIQNQNGDTQTIAVSEKAIEEMLASLDEYIGEFNQSFIEFSDNVEDKLQQYNELNSALYQSAVDKSDEALTIAKGRNRALCFFTYQELSDWLNGDFQREDGKTKADLQTGDNLYIVETGVPDYWWDGTQIRPLETQKVDLSEYAEKDYVDEEIAEQVAVPNSDIANYLEVADILGIWKNATAGRTDFQSLFENSNIKTVPVIDTSSGTNFSRMFYNCVQLETVPLFDTSNATNFLNMFYGCTSLKSIPAFNTAKLTNAFGMVRECTSLVSFKGIDISKVTNCNGIFYGCTSLEEVEIDMSSVTVGNYLFYKCSSLKTVKTLDFSNLSSLSGQFYQCTSLESVEFVPGSIKLSMSMADCSKLDSDSVASIFAGLADLTDSDAQTLTLHKNVQITQAQADGAVAKNWNIVGGTVNG